MQVAICQLVTNKSKDFETLAYKFENKRLTVEALADHINQGHAFTTWHTGGKDSCRWRASNDIDKRKHRCENDWQGQHRRQENFLFGDHLGLDFENLSPAQAFEIISGEFAQKYACIIYNTPSHTEDSPRFRIIFRLETTIKDASFYRRAVLAVMARYGLDQGVDKSCKDPCRLFYGSKGSNPLVMPGNVLQDTVLDNLILEFEKDQSGGLVAAIKGILLNENIDKELNLAQLEEKKRRWQKMLGTMCGNLAATAKGERHDKLLRLAVTVGGYIAGESVVVDPYDARSRLEAAYRQLEGFDQRDFDKGWVWGIEHGKNSPLVIEMNESGFNPVFGERAPETLIEEIDTETGEILEVGKNDRDLVFFTADDEGNAQAFISIYGEDFRYCDAYGWVAWNGKFWDAVLAKSKIDKTVTALLRRRRVAAIKEDNEAVAKCCITNRSKINACIEGLEKRLAIDVGEFDACPDLLNCDNGVIDLKTGGLSPHSKEQKFTYCVPVDYNPKADCQAWCDFLKQVVGGGEDVISYLQNSIGYTLTGHTSEECLFYCYGPTRSGKGTFTETIMTLLGGLLSVETDFSTFVAKRDPDSSNFDLAALKPARAVFASESTRYQSLNPAKIKQLTGGNFVRCSFKHRDLFTYRPQFKMWMSSNWPVNGDVDDDALWGRVRVIEFPNSFLGKEDKTLKAHMKSQEVLEGVLKWAVEGAIEWYKVRQVGLAVPQEIKDATKSHRVEADLVQMWIEECCEIDETYWESNAVVMDSYKRWCLQNGTEPKQMRGLLMTLKAKNFFIGVQNKIDRVNSKGIQGLHIAS